jgi:ParB/RepB/Spo0J family partition protein
VLKKSNGKKTIVPGRKSERSNKLPDPSIKTAVERIVYIGLEMLTPAKFNPRKTFSEIELGELAKSIGRHGVLVPLLVRDSGIGSGLYEIIAGEKRYRAAKLAGLESVPTIVKKLSEPEAREVCLIDNLLRGDVHPLGEAEAIAGLLKLPGYDIQSVADRISKPPQFVRQRIQFLNLIPGARDAFAGDRINTSTALAISRLDKSAQERAFRYAFTGFLNEFDMKRPARPSVEIEAYIKDHILLDLHKTNFSKADEFKRLSIGPCISCKKRTGSEPLLFPDVKKKDTCTDPECFAKKIKDHVEQKKQQYIKRRQLSGEAVYLVSSSYRSEQKGVLSRNDYTEINGKIAKCNSTQAAIVVEGDPSSGREIKICVDRKCKIHHSTPVSSDGDYRNSQRKERKLAENNRKASDLVLKACLVKVTAPLNRQSLEEIAVATYTRLWDETRKRIAKRHEWEIIQKSYGNDFEVTIKKIVPTMQDDELARFLVEMSLPMDAPLMNSISKEDREKTPLLRLADRLGVQYDILIKAFKNEIDEEANAKKSKGRRVNKNEKGME